MPHLCTTACTQQACTTGTDVTHCTCNASNSKATDHSCFHHTSCHKGHPCAYAYNTQCGPCAAQEIRSCPYHTQAPDPRNVTIPRPMRGEPNLECPQTLSSCTFRQRTIRPLHAPKIVLIWSSIVTANAI